MAALFHWLWEVILSLIPQGNWLEEIPTVKALLQATTLARSRIATVLRPGSGFQTL